jgi:glycosyltransferase involved in cell wall biosynthesis
MTAQRQFLSAVLITHDAATQLLDCLPGLAFADEILIVDSGSTDDTRELAAQAGARVIAHPWLGFGPQKQYAVSQARHDWVLCIDADERVPAELADVIRATLAQPAYGAYAMPRSNFFMGRYLRHGEGYPDWSLRLFDRRRARWSDDVVHEKVLTQGPVGRIGGHTGLLHHSADSLAVYLDKQNRYTSLQAEMMLAEGRSASVLQMVLSPLLRFVKFYFFKGGVLDGVPGLVHIGIGCFNSFVKYAKVRAGR